MKQFVRLSVAILILLFPVGCKKKAETTDEAIQAAESVSDDNFIAVENRESGLLPADTVSPENSSDTDDASVSLPPPRTQTVPAPPERTAGGSSQASASKSGSDRIDDMFIYKMTLKRVVPEDYLIGPLENLQNSDYRVSQILKTLNTFFRDLRIGTLNEDCIHPSAVLLLSSAFQFYLEEEAVPDVVRIGKAEITGKSARVNLRFYRGNGVTDGEVILEETAVDKTKQWLITDCQADLMQLLDPYKPSEEPFQPGAYNFYNWE